MALGAALAESLASLSASRHCWLLVVKLPASSHGMPFAFRFFSRPFAILRVRWPVKKATRSPSPCARCCASRGLATRRRMGHTWCSASVSVRAPQRLYRGRKVRAFVLLFVYRTPRSKIASGRARKCSHCVGARHGRSTSYQARWHAPSKLHASPRAARPPASSSPPRYAFFEASLPRQNCILTYTHAF